jgi:drug/metabolite transporter (DMT)-like permease
MIDPKLVYLLLSVALSSGIFMVFKAVGRLKLELFPVVVINYLTCFLLGNLLLGSEHVLNSEIIQLPGFFPTASMGLIFVGTFVLMGYSTQKAGASMSAMASKMSVVIPVLVAVIFLGESIGIKGIAGVILALVSVYLVSTGSESGSGSMGRFDPVLLLVFLGSGMVDTGLNLIKYADFKGFNNLQFATITFGGAAVVALMVSVFQLNRWKLFFRQGSFKGIVLGVLLGTINYFSIVAMYAAIDAYQGKTGVFFTLNNIGVLLLTIFLGYFLGEKYNSKTLVGVFFAIIAILLLGF